MMAMSIPLHGVWRHLAIWGGVAAAALAFQPALAWLTSSGGPPAPGILHVSALPGAAFVVAGCFLAAALIAAVVGRLTNAAVGLFVLGCGLSYLAMRAGTVRELAFMAGASLTLHAIETMGWSILLALGSGLVFKVSGPLTDVLDSTDSQTAAGDGRSCAWSGGAWIGAAMGAAVIPAVWLVAQSSMKGQALAAVIIGAMAAGLAARLLRPNAWPILLFAAPCLFGGLAQLAAAFLLRLPLDSAFVQQALAAPLLPMPLDYAAGSLIGVSLGLGWGRSFAHGEELHAPAASVRSASS
jgi:hypothetical protein